MAIVDGKIRCHDCGETKPLSDFYPSIASKGCGRCRSCAKAVRRAAEENDPGRFKAYRKAHLARNPGAQRIANQKMNAKKKAQYLAHGPSKQSIRCSSCGADKPIVDFRPSAVIKGCGTCRACTLAAKREYSRRNPDKVNAARKAHRNRNLERHRAAQRERYRDNPDAHRNYNLGKYGITAAEYDILLAVQGGGCACCGAKVNRNGKRLFVDHDHETGVVRGILCHGCNAGIGLLGDNIESLRRALAYLERAPHRPALVTAPAIRINLMQGVN